jgi:hypothetical protein
MYKPTLIFRVPEGLSLPSSSLWQEKARIAIMQVKT